MRRCGAEPGAGIGVLALGCVVIAWLLTWALTTHLLCRLLKFVSPLGQVVRKLGRQRGGIAFVEPMLGDQSRQEGAVHAASHVVTGRNRQECPGVVVETDRVVETGRFGGLFAEAAHALGTVVEPPGGT